MKYVKLKRPKKQALKLRGFSKMRIFAIAFLFLVISVLSSTYVLAACSYTGTAPLWLYAQICKPSGCDPNGIVHEDIDVCDYCDGDFISDDGEYCDYPADRTINVICDYTTDPDCCDEESWYTWRVFLGDGTRTVVGEYETGYAYPVVYDWEEFCTPNCAGLGDTRQVEWSIGGDDCDPDTEGDQLSCCCGDDPGYEYITSCQDEESGSFCNQVTEDRREACCSESDECVYDDVCRFAGDVEQGRTCSAGSVWRDENPPSIVRVDGAPVDWTNTDETATVYCEDEATGCDALTYVMEAFTSDPVDCPDDYDSYTILSGTEIISSHVWVCAAAKDNAGNFGKSVPVEFMVDKDPPASVILSPEEHSWQTENFGVEYTSSDTGGSGLMHCRYSIYDDGDYKGTTVQSCSLPFNTGTIPVGPGSGFRCTTEGADTCRVEVHAVDFAGNEGTTDSREYSVALTPPMCSINSITAVENPQCHHASLPISTVYYSNDPVVSPGCDSGKFSVVVTATDSMYANSGIERVNFPATVEDSDWDDTSEPYSREYEWDSSDTFSDWTNIGCYAVSGLSKTTIFQVYRDVTAPAGGSITYPDGYMAPGDYSVSIEFDSGSDTESGIDAEAAVLEERIGTLDHGSCINWGSWGVIANEPVSPYESTVTDGNCYQYRYRVFDNVGNLASYESANELGVDNVPPAGPATTDEGDISTDTTLEFYYTEPDDAESGIDQCYIEIEDISDVPVVVHGTWFDVDYVTLTYEWEGAENGKTYAAKVKCRDNAGNEGAYGTASDGIIVDTEAPDILELNDVDPADTPPYEDIDDYSGLDSIAVYWRAADGPGESGVSKEDYAFFKVVDMGDDIQITDWAEVAVDSEHFIVLSVSGGTLPEELENMETYYFSVRVTDLAGHVAQLETNGVTVNMCHEIPCGTECHVGVGLGRETGICDGNGACYIGGGCNLGCFLPPSIPPPDEWVPFDSDNEPVSESDFVEEPQDYCGRTGAMVCGLKFMCSNSIQAKACEIDPPPTVPPVSLESGSFTLIPPNPSEFYGPENPFIVHIDSVTLDGPPVLDDFDPLMECVVQSPDTTYHFVRWGRGVMDLSFGNDIYEIPVGSDGEWYITSCALKTDFEENGGWVISEDTSGYTFDVDTTPPVSLITEPEGWEAVGVKFNIVWEGIDPEMRGVSSGIDTYDFQYARKNTLLEIGDSCWGDPLCGGEELLLTTQTQYEADVSGFRALDEPSAEFCFRVKARDNARNEGEWSCDAGDIDGCSCASVVFEGPDPNNLWVKLPMFTNSNPVSFDIDWGAYDDSAIQCYQLQYMIKNEPFGEAPVEPHPQDWTDWIEINDREELVSVWDESGFLEVNCTGETSHEFMPEDLSNIEVADPNEDSRTYHFRLRAIDNAVGTANIGAWNESPQGTWSDYTQVPSADIVTGADIKGGDPIPEGEMIRTGTKVTFSVDSDSADNDYTKVNESGVSYEVVTKAGFSDEHTVKCSGEQKGCNIDAGPWGPDDYDVTFWGFARDRAGNLEWSDPKTFYVRSPLGVLASTENLYMTLGSFEYVTLSIENRQDVDEEVSVKLLGYKYSKFLESLDGVMSMDKRELNITLLATEAKTVNVIVYTSDVGEDTMTVHVNSTLSGENASADVRIKVVLPAEFPGLSWPSLIVLFTVAMLTYLRFGSDRRPS